VKQNFPSAKFASARFRARACVVVAILFLSSACATLPRTTVDTAYATSQATTSSHSSQININTASAQELEKLPGVGKVIAERIVEHRGKYGTFHRPTHLMMVRGISDRKFRELSDLITTE